MHKIKILLRIKGYRKTNKEQYNKHHRLKRKNDFKFRILCNLRTRLYNAMKGNTKSDSTIKLIGCPIEKLKSHLQSKFQSGMTFENYGEWHIDHILPCASFDLGLPEEQQICFHYTHLQPLWAKDNIEKGNKIISFQNKHELSI